MTVTWVDRTPDTQTWTAVPNVSGPLAVALQVGDVLLGEEDSIVFLDGLSQGTIEVSFTFDAWTERPDDTQTWVDR